MSIRPLAALVALVASTSLHAQSFNVKFGSTSTPAGLPPPTFGGPSAQPGTWNALRAGQTVTLADLGGGATGVVLSHDGTCDDETCGLCPLDCANPSDPAYQQLMRSWFDSDCEVAGTLVRFANLAEGRYALRTMSVTACEESRLIHYALNVLDAGATSTFASSFDMGGGLSSSVLHQHVDTFDVPAGSTLELRFSGGFGGPVGVQLTKLDEIVNVCAGDGTSIACPCGNTGASGHGCANSIFAAGGFLTATGIASMSSDSLVLHGSNLSNASCTYIQGSVIAPVVLFDGILCVGGNLLRIGSKISVANASSYPEPGDAPVSVRGQIGAAGATVYYTTRYRNAASFCTPDTANVTNAIRVTWAP